MELFPDDVFLVAYPKSGITWLRFLVANYLTRNHCDFQNHHLLVPDVHFNPEQCSQVARPRFMKSHFPYAPCFRAQEYPRVVYLVRDGRDVAVSYYYFLLRQGNIPRGTDFREYLPMFNAGTIDIFSTWSQHVSSWLDHAPAQFLLLRYEDIQQVPVESLLKLLAFVGLVPDRARVVDAVEASRFENMKKQERQLAPWGKPADPTIPIVRAGGSGGWKEVFTDEMHKEFLRFHGEALRRLNYL